MNADSQHQTQPLTPEEPLPDNPMQTWGMLTTRRFFNELNQTHQSANSSEVTLPSNHRVTGKYTPSKIVGRGGMGEIWYAYEPALCRYVALKWLIAGEEENKKHSAEEHFGVELSFSQEAIITAQLDHPNIIPVYSLTSRENGQPQIAMKYVEGKSWDSILNEAERLTDHAWLDQQLGVLQSVAQSVAFAHSRGIVHRDLKPSQVMIGDFGQVFLMDWGLALLMDENTFSKNSVTAELLGVLPTRKTAINPAGSPAFMAPEQTEFDCQNITPQTDVYLLGGMLYYLLTGRAPHHSLFSSVAFEQAKSGAYTTLEQLNLPWSIPKPLVELMEACLQKAPDKRPKGCLEFIKILSDYRSGSTRKQESELRTQSIAETLKKSLLTYNELLEAEIQLSQSIELWPANQPARALRHQTLLRITQLAIANKDLRMARMIAERLEDGPDREAFLKQIKSKQTNVAVHALQRCWSIRTTFALAVAFFLLFLWYYRQNSINKEAHQLLEEKIWQLENKQLPDLAP